METPPNIGNYSTLSYLTDCLSLPTSFIVEQEQEHNRFEMLCHDSSCDKENVVEH